MNATRPQPDLAEPPGRGHPATDLLEAVSARPAITREDAELHRIIESTASRLLGLALARGVDDSDFDGA